MENSEPTFRVYRPKRGQRAFALFFLAFAIFFVIGSWGGPIAGRSEAKPMEMMIAVLLLIVGMGLTVNFFTATITFTADTIEKNSLFRRERLPLSGIRGRREFVVRGGSADTGGSTRYLKLVPNDDRLPALEFMKSYSFDEAFFRWFNSLPDLDAEGSETHRDSNFGLV
jgi:hypothetical protein